MLGVAYKQDIDDYRESPAIRVIRELRRVGAVVCYYDPYIPIFKDHGSQMRGEKALSAELLQSVDLVMITCAHTVVDYAFVQQNAKLIFDTKNVMSKLSDRDNIEIL